MPVPNPEIIGVTQKEAELYQLLVNAGEQDAAQLIKTTGFKRPTVYKSLYTLIQKGLASEVQRAGKAYFRPEPPQKLVEIAEAQYQKLNRARQDVSAILPDLVSAFTLSTERPVVNTFQGVKGLKQIYQDMLKTGKPIDAVIYTGDVEPDLFKWLISDFTKQRIAKKIPVRSILATGGWAEEYEQRSVAELRETRSVDSELYPIKHEIDIYGDKVSFIDFQRGGTLIGVVINHPEIANSMRAWFNLTWTKH